MSLLSLLLFLVFDAKGGEVVLSSWLFFIFYISDYVVRLSVFV
jgi:hypothetical protein